VLAGARAVRKLPSTVARAADLEPLEALKAESAMLQGIVADTETQIADLEASLESAGERCS
jgi:hypothetical protein